MKRVVCFLMGAIVLGHATATQKVVIEADNDYAPYSYVEDGELKGIYVDCGDRDQFALHYGSRRLHRELDRLKIAHLYEEFPDNHSSVDYRMDRSLPFLEAALRVQG